MDGAALIIAIAYLFNMLYDAKGDGVIGACATIDGQAAAEQMERVIIDNIYNNINNIYK